MIVIRNGDINKVLCVYFGNYCARRSGNKLKNGENFNLLQNEQVQNEGGQMLNRTIDDAATTIDMAKEKGVRT